MARLHEHHRKNQNEVGGANKFSLYKSDGTVGLSLEPETGKITFPSTGAGSGIYFGTNTFPTLKANAAGGAVFSNKVLFENGADFGTGNTLNASNVQFLNSTLANLGYKETPSIATVITTINLEGDINVSKTYGLGNYLYVTGSFNGEAMIGAVSLSNYSGSNGAFVAKCASDGSVIWAKPVTSSSGGCYSTAVTANAGGTVAVVGHFSGTTNSLGAGKEIQAVSNFSNGFVVTYDSNGNVQWAKALGGNGANTLTAVAISNSGTVAAGGHFQGTITTLGSTITCIGNTDAELVSYASNGNVQWAKNIGGTNTGAYGNDITVGTVTIGNSGNVTASGHFRGNITNAGACNQSGVWYDYDGFLIQYDSTGQGLWSKKLGNDHNANVMAHCQDGNDNIFFVGRFNTGTWGLGAGKDVWGSAPFYPSDGLVGMLNSSGTTQWAKPINGTGWTEASGVVLDNAGKLIVSGVFTGAITNLGTGFGLSASGGANDSDFFMLKLEPNGNITKSQTIGDPGYNGVTGITSLGSNGMFYMSGQTQSVLSLGNTRLVPGPIIVGWQGFDIVTETLTAPSSLSWSGGIASGTSSIALGNKAFASGTYSTALGTSSATGDQSLASGSSIAQGFGSTALGQGNNAVGDGSIALGTSNGANGSYSTSIGSWNSAEGQYSAIIGSSNFTNSYSGFVAGSGNWLTGGAYATCIGNWNGYSSSFGNYSTTIGIQSVTVGDFSCALGSNIIANCYMETVIGAGNSGAGSATAWIETDPLFEAGNDEWGYSPSNAITTLKNGETTLANKAWKAYVATNPTQVLTDPPATTTDSGGNALVVEGHTLLKGKVIIEKAQGDISMGIYGAN